MSSNKGKTNKNKTIVVVKKPSPSKSKEISEEKVSKKKTTRNLTFLRNISKKCLKMIKNVCIGKNFRMI